jgi:L,D-peptidoglycan transpeptidase YkuD (ErfK/YbiS/YcfS/YnhG family)
MPRVASSPAARALPRGRRVWVWLAAGVAVVVALAAGTTYALTRTAAQGRPVADAGAGTGAPSSAAPVDEPSLGPSRVAAPAPPSTPARTTGPSPTARRSDALPAGLSSLPAATSQLVVVSTNSYADTTATLQAYEKSGGAWRKAFGGITARIGARGFSDHKVEGDLATPTGIYGFGSTMYGISDNPGVRYQYHTIVQDDYWNENADTAGYNSFVHGADPGGPSEPLWQITPQYGHFAVINYNVPVTPANPPRGSGIFLHIMVPGHSTNGCVAVPEPDLVRVLAWLNPSASPRIVLAPSSVLSRY